MKTISVIYYNPTLFQERPMELRKLRASALQVKRTFGNLARVRLLNRDLTLPHLAVYHANLQCNAACSFCSRAADIEAEKSVKRDEVSLERIEVIFRALRALTSALYVAGGEPLLVRTIESMLELARKIGFYPVAINTNATLLDKRPDVPRFADVTVVSIHATDIGKTSEIFRIPRRLAEKTFKNILDAVEVANRHGNRVVANCVLTADNIRDAHDVLDFCLRYGISFGVVPAIEGYLPSIAGATSEELAAYRAFVARVIKQKHQDPNSVQGTFRFLERIQNLGRFDCRPTGIITVAPDGQIVNPCDYKYPGLPEHLGCIDGTTPVSELLKGAMNYRRGFTSCPMNCLKACNAEPALALEAPMLALMEHMVRPLADLW